jgi:hypothetical protein
MYSFRTNDDAPPIIEVKCLTKEAFGYGKQIAQEIAKPISKQEFAVLYAKLRVLCKWHSVPADEKTIMRIYYDELQKYPAISVRDALKPKYEWFPSFAELEKDIKEKSEHLLVFQEMFLGEYKEYYGDKERSW